MAGSDAPVACASCRKRGNWCKCSACKAVWYCSVACQRKHRAQHRAFCRATQAAQTAPSLSGAAHIPPDSSCDTEASSTSKLTLPSSHKSGAARPMGGSGTAFTDLPRSVLLRILERLLPGKAATLSDQPPHMSLKFGRAYLPDAARASALLLDAALQREVMQPECSVFASPHREVWRRVCAQTRDVLSAAAVCRLWHSVVRDDDVIKHIAILGSPVSLATATRSQCSAAASGSPEVDAWSQASIARHTRPPVAMPGSHLETMFYVDTSFVAHDAAPEGEMPDSVCSQL
jgi:MYND finger